MNRNNNKNNDKNNDNKLKQITNINNLNNLNTSMNNNNSNNLNNSNNSNRLNTNIIEIKFNLNDIELKKQPTKQIQPKSIQQIQQKSIQQTHPKQIQQIQPKPIQQIQTKVIHEKKEKQFIPNKNNVLRLKNSQLSNKQQIQHIQHIQNNQQNNHIDINNLSPDILQKIKVNIINYGSNLIKLSVDDMLSMEVIPKNVSSNIVTDTRLGFIILRHVNSELTNNYWKESYNCIRKYYPACKIMIIDDNSNYNFIDEENNLVNCVIIRSEFPKRGEFLPYYYYYKNKFCDKAVIIHDSVFIQKYVNFLDNNNVKLLWHFPNRQYDFDEYTQYLIKKLNNKDKLLDIYINDNKWLGCFGVMSSIRYDFLRHIVEKYNLFNLTNYISLRCHRCCFERIFAIICYAENNQSESYFGNIITYMNWGYNFVEYKTNPINRDIIKVWTGR